MDGQEKRVFRRKHALLSTLLQPTSSYLSVLRQQGIISAGMEKSVLAADGKNKMATLLSLMESGRDSSFSKVMFMLEQTGYSWVSDEIFADLQYEQGKLPLEDYVLKEADIFTNTLFGDRGFIDVSRKGDLTNCIASRHQVAKEAWKRQMNRKNKHVVEELNIVQKDVLKMFQDVDEFLRAKHKLPENGNANGEHLGNGKGTTAKDILAITGKTPVSRVIGGKSKGVSESEQVTYGVAVKMLQEKIGTLHEALENEIAQHEKLHSERTRCYELLNVEPSDEPLDDALERALAKLSKELGQSSQEKESKKKQVTTLDKQVRVLKHDLSSQIAMKNSQLDTLNRSLKHTEKLLKDARENFQDMTRKRDIYKSQVDYWKDRCDILEKTRRLGYYQISKVNYPVSLTNTNAIPGASSKRLIYYDPQLLDVTENYVYIKGDEKVHWSSTNSGTGNGYGATATDKSAKKNVVVGGYDPDRNTASRATSAKAKSKPEVKSSPSSYSIKESHNLPKPSSQYHANCVPADDLNINNSNNASSGDNYKALQKSSDNNIKSISMKSTSKVMEKSNIQKSQQQGILQKSKKQQSFSHVTNAIDYSKSSVSMTSYNSQMIPVYPNLGQATMTTNNPSGTVKHYEVKKAQTLSSGIYRPSPPQQPAPIKDAVVKDPQMKSLNSTSSPDAVRKSWVTPNGHVSYTNGMLGLSQWTQTFPGSDANNTPSDMKLIAYNDTPPKTPKEKFEESLNRETPARTGPMNNLTNRDQTKVDHHVSYINGNMKDNANAINLDQSYSSEQSKRRSSGYSSSSSRPHSNTGSISNASVSTEPKTPKSVTWENMRHEPEDPEHCKCCPRCCREAPYSHPFQGYIS